MATRARILADYVSGGTTAAEFDYLDGVTSNIQTQFTAKAPIAGPTFTGTVAIPNVANLETAVVANTAKVTNYNQTQADINALDITELGTVTSANLSNSAIVYPTGSVVNSGIVNLQGGNHEMNNATAEALFNFVDITCAIGNTIQFGVAGTNVGYRNVTLTTNNHVQKQLRYHTSDVSEGATSSLGTIVQSTHDGRIMTNDNSSDDDNTYNSFNMTGAFVAAQTTYYLGMSFSTPDANVTSLIYMNATYPVWVYHYEFKGDVLT